MIGVPYIRVSHVNKEHGITLDMQMGVIRTFAVREGIVLSDEMYIDEGKSAYANRVDKRPDYQRLRRDAQSKAFQVVIVYKTDRLARNARVQLQCRHDLRQLGIRVLSATQYNPDESAFGNLHEVLDAGLNQYYSDLLSARMKDVRRFEAENGYHIGTPMLGYKKINRELVFDEENLLKVKLITELFVTGLHGCGSIANILHERGIKKPNGETFMQSDIERIVHNPVYAGYVTLYGKTYKGRHEALWSEETYQRVQEVIHSRSRRAIRHTTRFNPLLGGIVFCADCGEPMYHAPGKAHEGRRYYECATKVRRYDSPLQLLCRKSFIYAEIIEQKVLAWLYGLGVSETIKVQARTVWTQRLKETPRPIDNREYEIRKLKELFLADKITPFEYEQRRAEIQNRTMPQSTAPDIETLMASLERLPEVIQRASQEDRRMFVQQLIQGVYAKRDRLIAIRPMPLFNDVFGIAADNQDWLTGAQQYNPSGHLHLITRIGKIKNPIILSLN